MNDRQESQGRTDAVGTSGQDEDAGQREQSKGISPLNPSSMPRAEDDEATYANSPEYHDRLPNNPSKPQQGAARERTSRDS